MKVLVLRCFMASVICLLVSLCTYGPREELLVSTDGKALAFRPKAYFETFGQDKVVMSIDSRGLVELQRPGSQENVYQTEDVHPPYKKHRLDEEIPGGEWFVHYHTIDRPTIRLEPSDEGLLVVRSWRPMWASYFFLWCTVFVLLFVEYLVEDYLIPKLFAWRALIIGEGESAEEPAVQEVKEESKEAGEPSKPAPKNPAPPDFRGTG